MYSETRRLRLVEKVLKIKNESLLAQIESLVEMKGGVKKRTDKKSLKLRPSDYAGCISMEEAKNLLHQVEQSRKEWERDI